MTRLTVNGKRARRTGVVVASMAVLGLAVTPGIAWASNPIADGSPVAVRSIATAPSEPGVEPEVACGAATPISDEELQKLIDEGKVVRAEEAGTAALTIEVPSEAATFIAREGMPALPTVEWAPAIEGVPAEVLDVAGVAPLVEGVALSCAVAAG
ncbi:light harvesting protein subunit alpha [Rhodococcus sp. IEGM 1366]|uniref:light harvesting protein subunit alpha n=1 Tax=Rhodococcus sp. IEGM 1366 TaxID=3082223 RepID=UPI002953691A|nr:light harvesting protein subunit alpha [Rhodococcus sp. IEGM 1366]MDV8065961.1 light harvesting protein subunit alpha [Rhodococcus sp. IEGM 1366]